MGEDDVVCDDNVINSSCGILGWAKWIHPQEGEEMKPPKGYVK